MTTAASTAAEPEEAAGPPGVGAWPTAFHAWTSQADFAAGNHDEAVAIDVDGSLSLAAGAAEGSWTSPWHTPAVPFTELVPSWQSATPSGTWVEIELQVRTPDTESQWYAMGDWAFDTSVIERRSTNGQADSVGRIYTDTFVAASEPAGGTPTGYRLRVTLHGGDASPVIKQVGASTARPGAVPDVTSEPWLAGGKELDVPAYSQSIHSREYPDFGGGAVWCSPTSISMVLSYWGTGPTAAEVAALPPDTVFDENGRSDGQVDRAAIHTWDHVYTGAGNWPFNTAYASEYGMDGSVRQYSSLRDVEYWIDRGVPVVVSIGWNNKSEDPDRHLAGSSVKGTDGHVMVVIGFTEDGDVIANDPASPSNAEVRHVCRRDQFERNWLRSSNGTTYIIKDSSIVG